MQYRLIGKRCDSTFRAPDDNAAIHAATQYAFRHFMTVWVLVDGNGLVIADHWEISDADA